MNISIIGPGTLGVALGKRLSAAGHDIVFAGGREESASSAVEQVPGAGRGTNAEAADHGEVVILAVPYWTIDKAIAQTDGRLEGKILWSCVNALKQDFSGLAAGFDTSAAEEVAKRAPGAITVAALPPSAEVIAADKLDFAGRRPSVFVCGDNAAARQTVAGLVGELGASAVDTGPLGMSRLVEPAMMLVVALSFSTDPPRTLGLGLLER
jgi:8-hydroxy-5-deazaflavin:NADPH oxidoreductase